MPTTTLAEHAHVERVMGTAVSFQVRGQEHPGAIGAAVAWLHAVDADFSTYRPDSAVCRFDRGELVRSGAGEDLRWVLRRCDELRLETDGYFDAYATGPFDPSGLVKGWAVQRAAGMLRAAGVDEFCINAGGDIVTAGRWRVGIRHPHDAQVLAAVIEVEDMAVATSGLYERGAHVVAPHSGCAPEGVLSVTVVGPELGTTDAYATAALAMGVRGAAWTLGLADHEAMTIRADETVLTTPGFPEVTG
jgi:thiamine biosynthesis lipoprotein